MSMPVATLPLAPIRIRSRRPVPTSALCTIISPSVSGVPDVVLVLQRRRAGAALGAVDDDEVRA